MKKILALLIALLMTLTAGGALAQEGLSILVDNTPDKIVPQTEDLGAYGQHVGRPIPVMEATRPVVDPKLPDYVPLQTVSGEYELRCSDVLPYLVKGWINEFLTYHPDLTFNLPEPYVGSAGTNELINGEIDFCIVSREPRPTDNPAFLEAFGYDMFYVPVCGGTYRHFGWLDAMGFCVNKDNPLESLTLKQIDAIYSATRLRGGEEALTWGDLGLEGEWADQPIVKYGVTHWNGFEEFIRLRALNYEGEEGAWRDDIITEAKVFNMAQLVANDKYGIAYSGLAYMDEDVKLLPIAVDDDGPFYAPSYENVVTAEYPFSRVMYINANKAPGEPLDPAIEEFLRFMLSKQAAEITADMNIYIPLTAAQANASREAAGLPNEDIVVTLDGADANLAGQAFKDKGVVFVPFVETLEAMGATVSYDELERNFTVTAGDNTALVYTGSKYIVVNDTEMELSANSKNMRDGRYMPIDGIAMITGATLDYDADANALAIAN